MAEPTAGRHRHTWSVIGSEYTPPLTGLEVEGLRGQTEAARRVVTAIESVLFGFTTVTYRCDCRLQTTRIHRGRVTGVEAQAMQRITAQQ